MIKTILPPATIGIIGGGQLGQMLAQSAKAMGYKVGVLDPTPASPAGQVSDFEINAPYDDLAALTDLAKRSDVLTYEFENVDLAALTQVLPFTEIPQGTELLRVTRNRITEKTFLHELGIPTVNFLVIDEHLPSEAVIKAILPGILKTTTGGYDGHGQRDIANVDDLQAASDLYAAVPAILEQRTSFIKEVSVMVTRDGNDEVHIWPVVENFHAQHVLQKTLAPALVAPSVQMQIDTIATKLANKLDLRGVLGIEMFVTADQQVLVNELAPRPHNSGHYSIEAMNVSQFEGHIRSIVGLPIQPLELMKPALMINLLGTQLTRARLALHAHPEWHFHDYGKGEIRPMRKLGHFTVLGEIAISKNIDWLTDKGE
ncbi:5-(carboxyamino)imidazole ribonucleotide synthase [Periweissella cryptocerci]|uniref:N5-carboxyaminoimidazole ribonucleotide synthase n=1 Tax=Periweissella cryptocerci TaxID=2506420 RepID=A0A4P6YS79_9LACO|nr:5-(carboxyamino)imidazole ribonucleotide synthase [Periweissella cryptocerci]QBO35496.1 5-(carboxyamino)imidazole ribonucleotide synthase [Periweissella cryptocerci]